MPEKPKGLMEYHLLFLDELRDDGVTNMYGAGQHLLRQFQELSKKESHEILSYWMDTFTERHNL